MRNGADGESEITGYTGAELETKVGAPVRLAQQFT
jgi:hypothetical protein